MRKDEKKKATTAFIFSPIRTSKNTFSNDALKQPYVIAENKKPKIYFPISITLTHFKIAHRKSNSKAYNISNLYAECYA